MRVFVRSIGATLGLGLPCEDLPVVHHRWYLPEPSPDPCSPCSLRVCLVEERSGMECHGSILEEWVGSILVFGRCKRVEWVDYILEFGRRVGI